MPRPQHGATTRSLARSVRMAVGVVTLGAVAGCATAPSGAGAREGSIGEMASRAARGQSARSSEAPSYDPSDPQAAMRHALATRDSVAMAQAIRDMPDDELLRLMTWGLAYHRFGNYEASNRALEAASKLAEERYTKSIRQQIGTALLNDNAADFVPSAHERAFMHYYGMLNYTMLGQPDEALVEARRANQFLVRYARENGARSFTIDGTVEYLAGLMHLGGDDRNDAFISLRKAHLAFDNYEKHYGVTAPRFVGVDLARVATRLGVDEVLASTKKAFNLTPTDIATRPGHGTLLVLVENGSIARRVEQKVFIPVLEAEAEALKDGGAEAALTVGIPIADRTISLFSEVSNSTRGYGRPYQEGMLLAGIEVGADFVTMAWPKYVLDQNGAQDIVVIADSARQPAELMDDLSAIAARGFEEEKPRILQRMVFRGLAKYALAKMAEKKAEDQGGAVLGFLTKVVTQTVAAKSESADIRSWSELPGEIRAARFNLPAGVHSVRIEIRDADGTPRTIDLGAVRITAGKVAVRSQYVTGTWTGATQRFANAMQRVDFKAAQDTASGIELAARLEADTLPRRALSSRGRSTDVAEVPATGRAGSRGRAQPAASRTAPRPAAATPVTVAVATEPSVPTVGQSDGRTPAPSPTAAPSEPPPPTSPVVAQAATPVAPPQPVVPDTAEYVRQVTELASASRFSSAAQTAAAGSARYPQNGTLVFLRAQNEYRTGQAETARALLERLVAREQRVPGASLLLAQISAELGRADDAVRVLRADAAADESQRAPHAQFLLKQGVQAYQTAVTSKRRDDFRRAITYLQASDAIAPEANAKFMTAVSAFNIMQMAATTSQTSKACADVKEGVEALALVRATLPEGASVSPETAKQLTAAMAQFEPYFEAAQGRYCQ